MAKKYVYLFAEGNEKMRNLLGGKGANLSGMMRLGLPVPTGFTVTTEACGRYYKDGKVVSQDIINQIFTALKKIEAQTGKVLGSPEQPLLLSVRSGARVSMPGMLDTILNLGLNDQVVEGMAKLTNNPRFAYDSYRRLIMMYADVVMGVSKAKFEKILTEVKTKKQVQSDADLDENDFKYLVKEFKALYKKELKSPFPQDPKDQLLQAVQGVFMSWENARAIHYRQINAIPDDWFTAVNVQSMVFGNMGNNSGSGVAFTRNPSTGAKELYGEYLMNAQGEDVVAGVRTPSPIARLEEQNPTAFNDFVKICNKLERHYKDVQDMEFTIENGKLYMLQTRNGKRSAQAALKFAIDMVAEGLLTKKEALLKIEPSKLDNLLHPSFIASKLNKAEKLAQGLPASPGAASGAIAFTAEKAKEMAGKKMAVLLVREETSTEDIEGMTSSKGILTATGGMTSHAAVVARGLGIACVVGCSNLHISEDKKHIKIGNQMFVEGDVVSIDGSTGYVYAGALETEEPKLSQDLVTVLEWADQYAKVEVRANSDNKRDTKRAYELGAKGVGLCRTEHMFFQTDRIKAVREMILSTTVEEREKALNKILPMQKNDFVEIYKEMNGQPVTIRFLDMPLHEFLPKEQSDIAALAKTMKKSYEELKQVVDSLTEFNPMLGFRGCRLSIVIPEIAKMQTRAVIEAAIEVAKVGITQNPEIMIPLVGDKRELDYLSAIINKTASEVMAEHNTQVSYTIGSMIEVPRAALLADEIAQSSEFFSFGSNDLTQMTYGFSRDDAGRFISEYQKLKVMDFDPFARIDEHGVGKLVERSVTLGRSVKKYLKCGICGEHAGNPESIEFATKVGLNYVSCSPYRVPIARLASAQASIKLGVAKAK